MIAGFIQQSPQLPSLSLGKVRLSKEHSLLAGFSGVGRLTHRRNASALPLLPAAETPFLCGSPGQLCRLA